MADAVEPKPKDGSKNEVDNRSANVFSCDKNARSKHQDDDDGDGCSDEVRSELHKKSQHSSDCDQDEEKADAISRTDLI